MINLMTVQVWTAVPKSYSPTVMFIRVLAKFLVRLIYLKKKENKLIFVTERCKFYGKR